MSELAIKNERSSAKECFAGKAVKVAGKVAEEFATYDGMNKTTTVAIDSLKFADNFPSASSPGLSNAIGILSTAKLIFVIPEFIKKMSNFFERIKDFAKEKVTQIAAKVMDLFASIFFALKSIGDVVKFIGTLIPSCSAVLRTLGGIPVLGAILSSLSGLGVACSIGSGSAKIHELREQTKKSEENLQKKLAWKEAFKPDDSHGQLSVEENYKIGQTREAALKELRDETTDKKNAAVARTTTLNNSKQRWSQASKQNEDGLNSLNNLKAHYEAKIDKAKAPAADGSVKPKKSEKELKARLDLVKQALAGDKNGVEKIGKLAQGKIESKEGKWAQQQKTIHKCNNDEALLNGDVESKRKIVNYHAAVAQTAVNNNKNEMKKNVFDLVVNIIALVSIVFGFAIMIASGFTAMPLALLITGSAVLLFSDSLGLFKYIFTKLAWQKEDAPEAPMAPALAPVQPRRNERVLA